MVHTHTLHHRIHEPRQAMLGTARYTLWASGVLIAMLLVILILFLGVFAFRTFLGFVRDCSLQAKRAPPQIPESASPYLQSLLVLGKEIAMPHYVFHCLDCRKVFTEILHIADLSKHQAKCPSCGSTHVEQQAAEFSAMTSKKS
jgi:putative FmdB family regulatory protein